MCASMRSFTYLRSMPTYDNPSASATCAISQFQCHFICIRAGHAVSYVDQSIQLKPQPPYHINHQIKRSQKWCQTRTLRFIKPKKCTMHHTFCLASKHAKAGQWIRRTQVAATFHCAVCSQFPLITSSSSSEYVEDAFPNLADQDP
uniref:Uncharacterized protein n=1 Tax=Eutreptiella gymnastica TaxID=73025 RepID=A0A7S1N5E3_9EUGL